jgi:recombinational DNA repair protein (RecF pathway)
MIEYFTSALVLDAEDVGELDKRVFLYTKELGKVGAKARSTRKITSKLSAYLEPFNFVKIRLIEKNGFQVVDALNFDKVEISPENSVFLQFIKEMTFEFQPDKQLWFYLRRKKFSYRQVLKILGFDPDFAVCQICGRKSVAYFSKTEQTFFCRQCAFKIPKNDLILLK